MYLCEEVEISRLKAVKGFRRMDGVTEYAVIFRENSRKVITPTRYLP